MTSIPERDAAEADLAVGGGERAQQALGVRSAGGAGHAEEDAHASSVSGSRSGRDAKRRFSLSATVGFRLADRDLALACRLGRFEERRQRGEVLLRRGTRTSP